ncbi:glycosyltransferase [Bacillus sp. CMF12]|uniref:glycosyltransferase n=1 Tax=Bacillaceae TaxID=186817 RepID=UPI001FB4C96F|nr:MULTISPECIES: glycosyltransferase [Bacillaceae]UOE55078.1 glycosyltransferase [Cytobacillus oceanisediminis]USK49536.1 glycosyltransferase [Bacillus sp. CMF12]
MTNYQVIWRGPVLDASGYGIASREYTLALDRLGVDLIIQPYTWNFPYDFSNKNKKKRLLHLIEKPLQKNKQKILIYHCPPGNIDDINKERKNFDRILLNTVWETEKIPSPWLPAINACDGVCVPCSQNMKAMIGGGVNVPVFLAPHGADTHAFDPGNKKLTLKEAKGKFVFVSVFDFQHRKNPETLLKAYWSEFTSKDNVLLVIKTYGSKRKKILKAISQYKRSLGFTNETAPLHVITGTIPEKQLKGLYTLGNAFILPTRGEGVGLPYIEALSSGIPVIATGWGGQMDFLNEQNSFLIDCKLENPRDSMGSKSAISRLYPHLFKHEDHLWAEADLEDTKRQMRLAYENPHLCKQKGQQGRLDMLNLTWDKAGILLKKAIEEILS